jgi:hypothetical protein
MSRGDLTALVSSTLCLRLSKLLGSELYLQQFMAHCEREHNAENLEVGESRC